MEANPKSLIDQINETVEAIKKYTQTRPEIGIILGTGLGGLTQNIDIEVEIDYEDLPHFPVSTVESHTGKLIIGKLSGRNIIAMKGRFHYYEGYSMEQITFPVRVMKYMGADKLLISNACGTMNPYFRRGDIMIIDDHINLMGDNPLIGPNNDELGPRFPDMSEPYSKRLIKIAKEVALENKIYLQEGVYAAMTGPTLETRAEYRFLRTIGSDVIGMSTVPECIVARHMDMEVLGLSIITDECYPEALEKAELSQILAAAKEAEPKLILLLPKIVAII
jgi:purine-nucleoside phosphorylase